jgi:hypothetical protein
LRWNRRKRRIDGRERFAQSGRAIEWFIWRLRNQDREARREILRRGWIVEVIGLRGTREAWRGNDEIRPRNVHWTFGAGDGRVLRDVCEDLNSIREDVKENNGNVRFSGRFRKITYRGRLLRGLGIEGTESRRYTEINFFKVTDWTNSIKIRNGRLS